MIAHRARSSSSTSARSTRSSSRAASASRSVYSRDPPVQPAARARSARMRAARRSSSRAARRRVYDDGRAARSPRASSSSACPILGICYGVQLTAQLLGGKVAPAEHARVRPRDGDASKRRRAICSTASPPARSSTVWMSPRRPRRRAARRLRRRSARAPTARSAAVATPRAQVLRRAVPPRGRAHAARRARSSRNFLFRVCGCAPTWTMASFVDEAVARDPRAGRRRRARRSAACRAASTRRSRRRCCHRAIGDRLTCIFVDNGLLRAGERDAGRAAVPRRLPRSTCVVVDAERALPRRARRRHRPRAEAQDHRPRVHRGVRGGGQEDRRTRDFLAQGTLYPDVIEIVSFKGPSRDDQEPPQRRRPARADAAQARRAAARAVQGRGARARRRARPAAPHAVAPAVPGPGPRGARASAR